MHTAQVVKAVDIAFYEAGEADSVFSYLIPKDVVMCDARIIGDDVYVFLTKNNGSVEKYKISIKLEQL